MSQRFMIMMASEGGGLQSVGLGFQLFHRDDSSNDCFELMWLYKYCSYRLKGQLFNLIFFYVEVM